MNSERFEAWLKRLEASEVALPEDLIGCSPEEIQAIEDRYGIRLPATYRRFLEAMGRRTGYLFAAEDAFAVYDFVLDLTDEIRKSLSDEDPELAAKIPPEALFVLSSGDEAYLFIRCEEGDDPPVYLLHTGQRSIEVAEDSLMDWLEMECETAEEAIADGHFERVGISRQDILTKPKPKPPVKPLPFAMLCPGCGQRLIFAEPSSEHTRWIDCAFLYNDAGTLTLVWTPTDPAYRAIFGDRKPWELTPEQQLQFEARLKPAPAGGWWRFANPARCPRCRKIISPPLSQSDVCLAYPNSLLLQHWIQGTSLTQALK